MDDIRVSEGFGVEERPGIGRLYWSAFRRKLRPAFASDAVGLDIVCRTLRSENTLVARRGADVVGVCGFHADGVGAVDLSWRVLRSALSLPAAMRAAVCVAPLVRTPVGGALVLDGICVDEGLRGLGIGSMLLAAADAEARRRGLGAVQLTVVDTNPRARRLYESRGFRPVTQGRAGVVGLVYGFDGYTVMQRGTG